MAYTDFPTLVRFWDFTEIVDDGVNRTDITDEIIGAILPDIALPATQPCTSSSLTKQRAIPTDEGAFLDGNNHWVVDRDLGNCLQPDAAGGGIDLSGITPHPNLGSDDFLWLVSGHSLSVNATGAKAALGAPFTDGLGNPSYIMGAANATGNGIPTLDPVDCVRDTLGNVATFSPLQHPWGTTQGDPDGTLIPYLWAIYRKDGQITRRIVQRHHGEEAKESVSAAPLVGDVSPNLSWLWYDQITYGAALFHFPSGAPDDIDAACDWMAQAWEDNFDDKSNSIWLNWAGDTDMKFSDAPLKATEMTGSENLGAGDAGSNIQLTPDRMRNYSNRSDVRIKHWWQCTEASGTTLVDSITGNTITIATGISSNISGFVGFTAPDLTVLPVSGTGLWQPTTSAFLFLVGIEQSRPQFSSASISYGDPGSSTNHQVTLGANLVTSLVRGDVGSAAMTALNASSDGAKFAIALARDGSLIRQWGHIYKTDSVPAEFLDSAGEILIRSVSNVGSLTNVADIITLATAKASGILMVEFPYGLPLDLDLAVEWMTKNWAVDSKVIWNNWNVIT